MENENENLLMDSGKQLQKKKYTKCKCYRQLVKKWWFDIVKFLVMLTLLFLSTYLSIYKDVTDVQSQIDKVQKELLSWENILTFVEPKITQFDEQIKMINNSLLIIENLLNDLQVPL